MSEFKAWTKLYRTGILKALVLGQLCINLPILVFVFGGFPFFLKANLDWYWKLVLALSNLSLGYLLAKLYWARMITWWRLKAFSWVDQEHWLVLKDSAERAYLIYPQFEAGETSEKRSFGEAEVISEINEFLQHLEEVELTKLDLESPWQMEFALKKSDLILELALKVLFLGLSIYYLIQANYIFGLLILVLVLLIGHKPQVFKLIRSDAYALKLSESGLDINYPKQVYIAWEKMQSVEMDVHDRLLILHYHHAEQEKKQEVKLDMLKIEDKDQFFRLISIYLSRHQEYYIQLMENQSPWN